MTILIILAKKMKNFNTILFLLFSLSIFGQDMILTNDGDYIEVSDTNGTVFNNIRKNTTSMKWGSNGIISFHNGSRQIYKVSYYDVYSPAMDSTEALYDTLILWNDSRFMTKTDTITVNVISGDVSYEGLTEVDSLKWTTSSTMYAIEKDTIILIPYDQFDSCYSAPVMILDSSAYSGTFHFRILGMTILFDYNSVAYPNNRQIILFSTIAASTVMLTQSLTTLSSDQIIQSLSTAETSAPNGSIYLSTAAGDAGNGNSPIYLHLKYQLIRFK